MMTVKCHKQMTKPPTYSTLYIRGTVYNSMRFPTAGINSIIQCLLFLTTKHISGHQIHQASVLDTDVILILTSVKTMKSRLKVIVLKDNKNYNMNRKENE